MNNDGKSLFARARTQRCAGEGELVFGLTKHKAMMAGWDTDVNRRFCPFSEGGVVVAPSKQAVGGSRACHPTGRKQPPARCSRRKARRPSAPHLLANPERRHLLVGEHVLFLSSLPARSPGRCAHGAATGSRLWAGKLAAAGLPSGENEVTADSALKILAVRLGRQILGLK